MNASAINFPKIQAGLARVVGQSLPDSCTIDRATATTIGGESWTAVGTNVKCRVSAFGNRPTETNVTTGARVIEETRWQISLPAGQDVLTNDRITFQSQAYKVIQVLVTSFELERRAICVLVE